MKIGRNDPCSCGSGKKHKACCSGKRAVKTADGQGAVEALFRDAERDRGQDPFTLEANRKGTRRVRELLGLKIIR